MMELFRELEVFFLAGDGVEIGEEVQVRPRSALFRR